MSKKDTVNTISQVHLILLFYTPFCFLRLGGLFRGLGFLGRGSRLTSGFRGPILPLRQGAQPMAKQYDADSHCNLNKDITLLEQIQLAGSKCPKATQSI